MIKKLFLFFLFLSSLLSGSDVKYSTFIDSQLELVYRIDDANITQDEIKKLDKKKNFEKNNGNILKNNEKKEDENEENR